MLEKEKGNVFNIFLYSLYDSLNVDNKKSALEKKMNRQLYSLDYSTPDSASTATAFLSGVKTNMGVVGYDGNVQYHNCTSTKQAKKLNSVLDWARAAGKKTGIITTSRVTHATPAAAYAHTPARWWEVINFIPRKDRAKCKDIAVQLIEDNDHINVIMGGGRSFFLPSGMEDPEIKSMIGFQRMDGRNLVEEWEEDKKKKGSKYAYVWNRNMFKDIDDDVEYILDDDIDDDDNDDDDNDDDDDGNDYDVDGLFNPSHMEYDLERTKYGRRGEPSMSEMVNKAISVLEKGDDGFVLIVEGARIDHGHHANMPMLSLNDVSGFDDAVKKAKQRTDADDTLIVVTADHSHGFDITGYQQRGTDIFGKQDEMEPTDDKPMTILHYANGPGHDEPRENLTNIDTTSSVVRFPAGVPLHSGTHSGEDVAIYANGPMSHLVNGVQEQSYIAFVMAYSACIGPYGTGRMNRWCKKGRT
ncbi:hypothetical protein ACF0H5_012758 [Mactra antiquata]